MKIKNLHFVATAFFSVQHNQVREDEELQTQDFNHINLLFIQSVKSKYFNNCISYLSFLMI